MEKKCRSNTLEILQDHSYWVLLRVLFQPSSKDERQKYRSHLHSRFASTPHICSAVCVTGGRHKLRYRRDPVCAIQEHLPAPLHRFVSLRTHLGCLCCWFLPFSASANPRGVQHPVLLHLANICVLVFLTCTVILKLSYSSRTYSST